MNKHIFKHIAMAFITCRMVSCQDGENDLLKRKVYFDGNLQEVETPGTSSSLDVDIASRLFNKQNETVNVSYPFVDSSLVALCNNKYGTDYVVFKHQNVTFSKTSSTIVAGGIYADKVSLTFNNLNQLEASKNYMLPIKLHSASIPVIDGEDVEYIVLAKPVKITEAGDPYNKCISVKFPTKTYSKSFTYEALIYSIWWGSNCTIMGSEGLMILCVGGVGGRISAGIL